jgi:hypothetical protein
MALQHLHGLYGLVSPALSNALFSVLLMLKVARWLTIKLRVTLTGVFKPFRLIQ